MSFEKRKVTIVLALLLLTGIALWSNIARYKGPYYVSLVEVLANPGKHMGNVVIVSGYFDFDNGLYLYLTRDHRVMLDSSSAIRVTWPDSVFADEAPRPCVGKYVRVRGTLSRLSNSAAIWLTDIDSVELAEEQRWCWQSTKDL